jgi:hypothetical protein
MVSVADPEPDPSVLYVFGPPGSGSIITRSGAGFYFYQAKIVRKTLIPIAWLLFYDFRYLKNDVNVASKSNRQKT